jgi:monoamine oxidase
MSTVIVIGAGAAGLMVAYKLSKAGHKVIVLEAQDRLGGRIHTLHDPDFSVPVELGAEFIHGDLPVTNEMMREAGLERSENGGSFWNADGGKLKQGYGVMRDWAVLEKALNEVKEDMTIAAFLDTYLSGYEELRMFVKGFVEGYDAADANRASVLAFRDEWMSEEGEENRVEGGYSRLIDYMAAECKKNGGEIYTSAIAKEIKWNKGNVVVQTDKGVSYHAEKVVVTVPAGVLQEYDGNGVIKFTPAIEKKSDSFQTIGYGNAMKVFLQFNRAFWQDAEYVNKFGKGIKELGFIVSDAKIPVWWTQAPVNAAMLTGWIGGPNTDKFLAMPDAEILDIAIDSIVHIFGTNKEAIQMEFKKGKVANWINNPFERGGYTYATVEGLKLKDKLDEPIEDTIYFAGEAFFTGAEMGTVEAALASGKKTAELIIG